MVYCYYFIQLILLCFPLYLFYCFECCDFTTRISNVTNGEIDYHFPVKYYKKDSHCDWLIEAPARDLIISLWINSFDTECLYDIIYVYDGALSDSRRLIAYFSGYSNATSRPLYAYSGSMYVHMFSDRNFVRPGFKARFVISTCPSDCKNQNGISVGTCEIDSQKCICSEGYSDADCHREACPYKCSPPNGHCVSNGSRSKCSCAPKYMGIDCSLSIDDQHENMPQKWTLLSSPSDPLFLPRAGHCGGYHAASNKFIIFGGHSFSLGAMNDLWLFSFTSGNWSLISQFSSLLQPQPRYQAAHSITEHGLLVYGGLSGKATTLNDLWYFFVLSNSWDLIRSSSQSHLPALSSHTLTAVNTTQFYIVGGRLANGTVSSHVYRLIVTVTDATYTLVDLTPSESIWTKYSLFGHTTVYDRFSHRLIILGGYTPVSVGSSHTYGLVLVFDITSKLLFHIFSSPQLQGLRPMLNLAYHSATVVGHYVVVFGGINYTYQSRNRAKGSCYSPSIHWFDLYADHWVSVSSDNAGLNAHSVGLSLIGRYSHVSSLGPNNLLLVHGGFQGTLSNELLAYTASYEDCYRDYLTRAECLQRYPDCHWCSSSLVCLSVQEECSSVVESPQVVSSTTSSKSSAVRVSSPVSAALWCGARSDCESCMSSRHPLISNRLCKWCSKTSRCVSNDTTCSNEKTDWHWWTNADDVVRFPKRCLTAKPSGVTLTETFHDGRTVLYKRVLILPSVLWNSSCSTNVPSCVISLRGFIHIPTNASDTIRVHSSLLHVHLFLSADSSERNLRRVTSGSLAFPRQQGSTTSRRYLFVMNQTLSSSADVATFILFWQLSWTTFHDNVLHQINQSYLEPWFNTTNTGSESSCYTRTTCASCLVDLSCIWCTSTDSCHSTDLTNICPRAYVTLPNKCPSCGAATSCENCLQQNGCEWSEGVSRLSICYHDGISSKSSLHNRLTRCKQPCYKRSSCSECINGTVDCVWCDTQSKCLSLSDYTALYTFAQCDHWTDTSSTRGLLTTQCDGCAAKSTDCKTCLMDHRCGWCSESKHHALGVCTRGDPTGPSSPGTCSSLILSSPTVIESMASCNSSDRSFMLKCENATFNSTWSFAECPLVDECSLGLHKCHPDADCIDTKDDYECMCKPGFTGDGVVFCNQTCVENCVYGECSGAPNFICQCQLGWYGANCSQDCGCHNHSTCSLLPGSETAGGGIIGSTRKCDMCHHNTAGRFCEKCVSGYFGDATTSLGCNVCNCNGHADERLGFCDSVGGSCYCAAPTVGKFCQHCMAGYYGDPRNGGRCYRQCKHLSVLSGVSTTERFGSYPFSPNSELYCVWILSARNVSFLSSNSAQISSASELSSKGLRFQIESISINCSKDYVYVYSGVPQEILGKSPTKLPSKLLGVFCGHGTANQPGVIDAAFSPLFASNGIMTVVYHAYSGVPGMGFNASVHPADCKRCNISMLRCLNDCSQNGFCNTTTGFCKCLPSHSGADCNSSTDYRHVSEDVLVKTLPITGGSFEPATRLLGYTIVYCRDSEIYLFGGIDAKGQLLNGLYRLFRLSEWTSIKTYGNVPASRYFHAAVCSPFHGKMFMLGGMTKELDPEPKEAVMWILTLSGMHWTSIPLRTPNILPTSLIGHTMTLVGLNSILIVGGISHEKYFHNISYVYNISGQKLTAEKPPPINGLFAHTAMYNSKSKKVYVYGGFGYDSNKVSTRPHLYVYSGLLSNSPKWHRLPYQHEDRTHPKELFFQAAAASDDLLFLSGGLNRERRGSNHFAWLYYLPCHIWVPLDEQALAVATHLPHSAQQSGFGASAFLVNGSFVVLGGNSLPLNTAIQISIPSELCKAARDCEAFGCVGCNVAMPEIATGSLQYCAPSSSDAYNSCRQLVSGNVSVSSSNSKTCSTGLTSLQRSCRSIANCIDCNAVFDDSFGQKCKWCSGCPFPQFPQCVDQTDDCRVNASICNAVVTNPKLRALCSKCKRVEHSETDQCFEVTACHAVDCFTCNQMHSSTHGHCVWLSSLKIGGYLERNCVSSILANVLKMNTSRDMDNCPTRCHQRRSCAECLGEPSAESGIDSCIWSAALNECMTPPYSILRCVQGVCGFLTDDIQTCSTMQTCPTQTQCSTCLAQPGCGWCGLVFQNGLGSCMRGGLLGPLGDFSCSSDNVTFPANFSAGIISTRDAIWASLICPPENECANGHHNCSDRENCVDLPVGFRCDCKPGYERKNNSVHCEPVCRQGCVFGSCVKPNDCQCHFGFTGSNCSFACNCNGHSECPGPNQRDVCLRCRNNTKGAHCEYCKPGFVGDPAANVSCISCNNFCNSHSSLCSHLAVTVPTFSPNHKAIPFIYEGERGPTFDEAECTYCQNSTTGARCESCLPGYFRQEDDESFPCTRCMCNGHASLCDNTTGINCRCTNHTTSPCDYATKKTNCHLLQCSVCEMTNTYKGNPINGRQCYKILRHEADDSFVDVYASSASSEAPLGLEPGEVSTFVVQPRFLNVDIRLYVDVTAGAVDVFMSSNDSTFIVDYDPLTNRKYISVAKQMKKFLVKKASDNQPTYMNVPNPSTVLYVRDVRFRLVLTLPATSHDLKRQRFYVIIRARSGQEVTARRTERSVDFPSRNRTLRLTEGYILFRQDQPQIDLFVFFSVFFSAFFQLLALCVIVWKMKRQLQRRRAIVQRAIEMKNLAARPFANVLILLEPSDMDDTLHEIQQTNCDTRSETADSSNVPPKRSMSVFFRQSRIGISNSNARALSPVEASRKVPFGAITAEPCLDGNAVVASVLFNLPGGLNAPSQLCVGSTLTYMRQVYPSVSGHGSLFNTRIRNASRPCSRSGQHSTGYFGVGSSAQSTISLTSVESS